MHNNICLSHVTYSAEVNELELDFTFNHISSCVRFYVFRVCLTKMVDLKYIILGFHITPIFSPILEYFLILFKESAVSKVHHNLSHSILAFCHSVIKTSSKENA